MPSRLVIGLLGLIVLLPLVGGASQWYLSRLDRERFPAPGRLVAVGDTPLHIDCRGSGGPIVVLEAGLMSGSSGWLLVHDALAAEGRVCAYDRPGLDWSPPAGPTPEADAVAARLRALLEAAGEPAPYLIVGMSAGGVYVREFARQFPELLAGMVLVDSSHEEQGVRLPDTGEIAAFQRVLDGCAWVQPLGIVRLTGAVDAAIRLFGISAEAAKQHPEGLERLRANMSQSHACATMADESRTFTRELADGGRPPNIGALPLIVLSQDPDLPLPPEGDPDLIREHRRVWVDLQQELVALSSEGERRVAAGSGHVIQLDRPDMVIEAITGMRAALRAEVENK
jgi:pimeloyl-ACP methyl ester carboxylesterase